MGPGEHSHADYLSPEIPGHLKLVLSEFLEIGKLEISRRTGGHLHMSHHSSVSGVMVIRPGLSQCLCVCVCLLLVIMNH